MSTISGACSLRPGIAPESASNPDRAVVPGDPEHIRGGALLPLPPSVRLASEDSDESLVADPRAGMTPAQMVEQKLLSLLDGRALPVSHVQMVELPRIRRGK